MDIGDIIFDVTCLLLSIREYSHNTHEIFREGKTEIYILGKSSKIYSSTKKLKDNFRTNSTKSKFKALIVA